MSAVYRVVQFSAHRRIRSNTSKVVRCCRTPRVAPSPTNHYRQRRSYATPAPQRAFTFHVGASFIGKPMWPDDQPISAAAAPPTSKYPTQFPETHPVVSFRERMLGWKREVPSEEAGQDFFFIKEMRAKSVKGLSIGIADGVGGWSDICDPSLFSQALMYYASRIAGVSWPGEPESDPTQESSSPVAGRQITPEECLEMAHQGVLRDPAVPGGGSTACIMNFEASSGKLRAANLGDSGFYIVRGSQMHHAEPPQTHFFNCPWQLSKYPPGYMRDGHIDDSAVNASLYQTRLRHGDIVILYTDGLSDNVFANETLNYTLNVMRQDKSDAERAQRLADFLVVHARRCMFDHGRVSPFEVEWAEQQQMRRAYRGGKVDDVSVIVVIVEEGPTE